MKHSREDVLEAVKLLSEVCGNHVTCADCPLRRTINRCYLVNNQDKPQNWNVVGEVETWRAFL